MHPHDEVAPIELSEVLIGHNMHQSFEVEDAFNKIDQLDSAWGKDATHKRFSEYKRLLQSEEEKGKGMETPRDRSVRIFANWMATFVYPNEMPAVSKRPFKKNKKAKKKAASEAKKMTSLDAKNLSDAILFFLFTQHMNDNHGGASFDNFDSVNHLVIEVSSRLMNATSNLHIAGVVLTLEHIRFNFAVNWQW